VEKYPLSRIIFIIIIVINNHCCYDYSFSGVVPLQCLEILRNNLEHVEKSRENGRRKIKTLCAFVCVRARARAPVCEICAARLCSPRVRGIFVHLSSVTWPSTCRKRTDCPFSCKIVGQRMWSSELRPNSMYYFLKDIAPHKQGKVCPCPK
jgi:hypothetical protein